MKGIYQRRHFFGFLVMPIVQKTAAIPLNIATLAMVYGKEIPVLKSPAHQVSKSELFR